MINRKEAPSPRPQASVSGVERTHAQHRRLGGRSVRCAPPYPWRPPHPFPMNGLISSAHGIAPRNGKARPYIARHESLSEKRPPSPCKRWRRSRPNARAHRHRLQGSGSRCAPPCRVAPAPPLPHGSRFLLSAVG